MRALALLMACATLAGCASSVLGAEERADRAPNGCADIEPYPDVSFWPAAEPAAVPSAPTIGRAHAIERDEFGMPRIQAESAVDAWEQLGYATAQDRLWQLEVVRRGATGTLAEIMGADTLASDRLERASGFTTAEREVVFASLDEGARATIAAYVGGINARIDEVLRDPTQLPREFVVWGIAPTMWRESDAIAILEGGLGDGLETRAALAYLELVESVGEDEALARLRELAPGGSERAPVTLLPEDRAFARAHEPPTVPASQRELVAAAVDLLRGADGNLLPVEPPIWRRVGSNAIALSGEHTVSGAPLLMGGPQVGYTTPATYWEAKVDVEGARWHVYMKPGEAYLRGMLHSGAYVMTTGYTDMTDLVVLRLDPSDPERYLYGDETLAFDTRVERYVVADRGVARGLPDLGGILPAPPAIPSLEDVEAPAHVEVVRRWHRGPVLAVDPEAGVALAATRWPGPGMGIGLLFLSPDLPALSKDPAQLREAMKAHSRIGSNGNIIAAFADGVVSYWHQSRHPVRAEDYERRLPLPGEPGSEWSGRIGPDCMAMVDAPEGGMILNWNNAVARGWPMEPRVWGFGDQHRHDRLDHEVRAMRADGKADVERLNAAYARTSTRSALALQTVPLLAALAPAEDELAAMVVAWHARGAPILDEDEDGLVDDPGVAAFEAWRAALQERIFADELGDEARPMNLGKDLLATNADDHAGGFSDSLLVSMLYGRSSDWWDDVSTPQREEPRAVVMQALDDARKALQDELGDDWRRPMARIRYTPLGLGPDLDAPVQYRGSINYIVDLGDRSMRTILTPGQSGHVDLAGAPDPHTSDQLEMYARFEYKLDEP